MKVSQVMEFKLGENFQPVGETLSVREILARDPATGRRAGAVVVVDGTGMLAGVFTDGDLRRQLRLGGTGIMEKQIFGGDDLRNPKRVHKRCAAASEALAILNQFRALMSCRWLMMKAARLGWWTCRTWCGCAWWNSRCFARLAAFVQRSLGGVSTVQNKTTGTQICPN